jgi:hypothetical protein
MDVDSDDDDEIIAERGTSACILIFFTTRARVYTSFSLISSHSTTTKGKAAIFESENNGQHDGAK